MNSLHVKYMISVTHFRIPPQRNCTPPHAPSMGYALYSDPADNIPMITDDAQTALFQFQYIRNALKLQSIKLGECVLLHGSESLVF